MGSSSRAARGGRLVLAVPPPVALRSIPTPLLRRGAVAAHALVERMIRAADPVRSIEQQLVDLLSSEWSDRIPQALRAALDAIAHGDSSITFTQADLDRVIAAARDPFVSGWSDAVGESVEAGIADCYDIGRKRALKPLGLDVDWNLVDDHARGVLQSDTMYWVGGAWDNQLGGQIAGVIQSQVIEQGLSRREAGEALQGIFGETFPERSAAYWNVVASAGTVRARTFGTLGSFEQAEVVTYRWLAIEDARTCEICSHLDGKVFSTESAVKQRDAFLAAESPDDAKAAHPWVSAADVKGKSAAELEADGTLSPPVHGHCRCVLTAHAFRGEAPADSGSEE